MRKIIAIIVLITATLILFAQSDYEKWLDEEKGKFHSYRQKQDEDFADFLKNNWNSFEAYRSESLDRKPKPKTAPKTEPIPLQPAVEEPKIEKIELKTEVQEKKESRFFVIDKDKPILKFNYFGLMMEYNFPEKIEIDLQTLNEKSIANFWLKMSDTDHQLLLSQLKTQREKMNINDWGYCQLLYQLGQSITEAENKAKLFTWFMLIKSDYDAKVGYYQDDVFLLIPSGNKIFDTTYVMVDNVRYYAIDFGTPKKIISLKTYEQKYPDADAFIDLSVTKSPKIKRTILEKELKFTYENKEYIIPVKYDVNAVEYFKNYPQTDLDVYFNAPLSPLAMESLTTGLKPTIEGKNESEAANVLLRFVQTAFQYKTDDEQFGKEKYFFSDEMLYYPYCDCEDRSVLYSFLVRNLLDLTVIGLDYPGHISTAVNFHSEIPGDHIIYQDEKFLICDPTYINANLGMAMPQFKELTPEVIDLAQK